MQAWWQSCVPGHCQALHHGVGHPSPSCWGRPWVGENCKFHLYLARIVGEISKKELYWYPKFCKRWFSLFGFKTLGTFIKCWLVQTSSVQTFQPLISIYNVLTYSIIIENLNSTFNNVLLGKFVITLILLFLENNLFMLFNQYLYSKQYESRK